MNVNGKVLAAVALIVVAGGVLAVRATTKASPREGSAEIRSLLRVEHGEFVYEFHAVSGTEGLYAKTGDPRHLRNLLSEHPDAAGACRRKLLEEQGVPSLEALRAKYAEEIRRIHALGYL